MFNWKYWISVLIKYTLGTITLVLAWCILALMQHPKASPLPAIIALATVCAIDLIIPYILIKTHHENSRYFDPEHGWKYKIPVDMVIYLVAIVVSIYQIFSSK